MAWAKGVAVGGICEMCTVWEEVRPPVDDVCIRCCRAGALHTGSARRVIWTEAAVGPGLMLSAYARLSSGVYPPPPLYKLRPCPSYSRRRDRINLVPNFNSVPNSVQPHKPCVW